MSTTQAWRAGHRPREYRRRLAACALALFVGAGLATQSGSALATKPQSFELDNGLKLIVKEDHRAPIAVHMVWYRAGSADEVNGQTGIAHVLEHMMFKGTSTVAAGEFSNFVARAGGRENAFTSRHYTAYYQQIGTQHLDRVMELEADRMARLTLDSQSFAKELEVVKEERRQRVDDQPMGRVSEQLMASALVASPYRRPVIGWPGDLEQLKVADAREWYRSWYGPNNAVVIVAGDVDPDQVLAQVRRHYGGLARIDLPTRRPQPEPVQQGQRRAVVLAPADSPYVVMAFKVPRLRDIDSAMEPYSLEVLANVLSGGDTARLTTSVVRGQRLANDAYASYGLMGAGPALFTLGGTPAKGKSTTELEAALRAEIARVARDGVDAAELERIKAGYVASQVYRRDSLFAQVMELGALEMLNLPFDATDRILDRVAKVNSAQVQAVAGQFFKNDTMTVVTLQPTPGQPRKPASSPKLGRH